MAMSNRALDGGRRRPASIRLLSPVVGAGLVSLAFVLGAPNPFDPDVCTSEGYGYPLAGYIEWCACFGAKTEVRFLSIFMNAGVWAAMFLLFPWAWRRGRQELRRR